MVYTIGNKKMHNIKIFDNNEIDVGDIIGITVTQENNTATKYLDKDELNELILRLVDIERKLIK